MELHHLPQMGPVAPNEIRFIKLGPDGNWAWTALAKGEIPFGYPSVPHPLCEAGDWEAVGRFLIEAQGRRAPQARAAARDLKDFYALGADCLWITIAEGYLWWAFAAPDIVWLGGTDAAYGARVRRVLGAWRRTDLHGDPLWVSRLGAHLPHIAKTGHMIRRIKGADALIRRINAVETPLLVRAREARREMIAVARDMIAKLPWSDFVMMVDMTFARSGWRRVSQLDGFGKELELTLEEPATARTALAQVKPRAEQSELDAGVQRFVGLRHDQMFFICRTSKEGLTERGREDLHVWTQDRLADMSIRAGLYEWLIERSA